MFLTFARTYFFPKSLSTLACWIQVEEVIRHVGLFSCFAYTKNFLISVQLFNINLSLCSKKNAKTAKNISPTWKKANVDCRSRVGPLQHAKILHLYSAGESICLTVTEARVKSIYILQLCTLSQDDFFKEVYEMRRLLVLWQTKLLPTLVHVKVTFCAKWTYAYIIIIIWGRLWCKSQL